MKQAGKYRVVEKVEQTNTHNLYRAEDEQTGKIVMLYVASSAEFNEQVEAKAKALGSVKHPAVAAVYDQGLQREGGEQLAYFAYENAGGERLEALMERHPEIPLKEKLELIIKLCEAVHALNGAGNVCLCTPDDVLVKDGAVKIMDVHAKLPPNLATSARVIQKGVKRIPFWSPEVITGEKERDRREDVFALGLLTYVFVAGEDPFGSKNPIERAQKVMGEGAAPLTTVAKNCPPQLEAVVKKALKKKREDRQQSVRELQAELRLVAVGL